jgi:hypothetical protein
MMGRSCSRLLHSETPETYAKSTPIINSKKQKTTYSLIKVILQRQERMYRPYLYRNPIGSTVADFSDVTKSQAQLNVACDLRRSRLFASEARNGLPKRTQGLTTSAKPFLLLSWILLARPSKGKRRPLSSHMFCNTPVCVCVEVKKLGLGEVFMARASWEGKARLSGRSSVQ